MTAPCNCIETVDAKLAERNTRIKQPLMFGEDQTSRAMIVTEVITSRRGKMPPTSLFATYCPFCGIAYRVVQS